MALFEMHYRSDVLRMQVTVNVVLPERFKNEGMNGAPCKMLYLLHGLADDRTIWGRRTSVERYADDRGLALVMPEVTRSWYTDTTYGANYLSFIAEELPSVCRNFFPQLSAKREDTFIAGLSMGGYGAVKAAFTHPDRFGGCASLSGALDIIAVTDRAIRNNDVRVAEGEWQGIFGQNVHCGADLAGSKDDLYAIFDRALASGADLPKIFLWCGTDDRLIEDNRRVHAFLNDRRVSHAYSESEGNHSWRWWDLHIQDAMDFLLK